MNPFAKFALRAAVGFGLAYFIVRIYVKKNDLLLAVVVAAFLVGMAYLAERIRRNREE